MKLLAKFNQSYTYWLFIIIAGAAMEAAALYYQYVLGDEPCVLCIHVRIAVAAMMVVGAIGLLTHRNSIARKLCNGLSIVAAIGFLERSWQTLATERGWADASCAMNAGLPAWFDLENWLPAIFEVRDACGFTPYIIGSISMAEILVVTGIAALLTTVLMTIADVIKPQ